MNEEEVKLKIVNDWLKDCGFSIDDLCFEDSFHIKLGKSVYKVDTDEMRKTASPRLDVLVKNKDGKNLFIMELKADDINISKDDINQGCSYAKQLDQIAPFTIITNGKTTKIFDSITKQEVTKKIQIGDFDYTPSIEEDLKFRYEALRDFIGLSTENLAIFSELQIKDRMSNIKGVDSGSQEKYIPKLFIPRESLCEDFEEFLNSDSACFSIIGESGTGKTDAICDLALKYASSEKPKVLAYFYNATELSRKIMANISEDFNLNFSEQNGAESIIKRLSNLTDKNTVLFFDAIDENNSKGFSKELDDFVRILKNNNIKICFTCKDTEYDRFLVNKGNPTTISKNVFVKDDSQNKNVSFSLNEFSDTEYESIKRIYIDEYNLKEIPNELYYDLKNGFLLRIYAETHRDHKEYQAKNIISMLEEYLKQKFQKMDSPEVAGNTLKKIGGAIWNNSLNNTYDIFQAKYILHDKIEEQNLRDNYLKISSNDKICPELFDYKILQRNPYDNDIYIGFYYTRLRDYVVGFQFLKLDKKSDLEFQNILETLYSSNIGVSIIQWYYKFAKKSHKNILDAYYIKSALDFTEAYNSLINKFFSNIKNIIMPNITDSVAIAMQKDPLNPYYCFYPAKSSEDKITTFDNYSGIEKFWREIHGQVLGGLDLVKAKYPLAYACHRLSNDVKKIADSTPWNYNPMTSNDIPLHISGNPIILNERITKWFEKYAEAFDFCRRPEKFKGWDYSSTFSHILPLTIDGILNHIEKLKVKYYLAEIKEKYDETNITINGMFCHVNPSVNPLHFDNDNEAEDFIKSGKKIPYFRLEYLDELLILLEKYKRFSDIVSPVLPEGDIKLIEKMPMVDTEGKVLETIEFTSYKYGPEQNEKYIETLQLKTYEAYIYFIEENFSDIKYYFELYSNLPIRVKYCIDDVANSNVPNGTFKGLNLTLEKVPKQKNKIEMFASDKETITASDNFQWALLSCNERIEEQVYRLIKRELKQVFEQIKTENNIEKVMKNWSKAFF